MARAVLCRMERRVKRRRPRGVTFHEEQHVRVFRHGDGGFIVREIVAPILPPTQPHHTLAARFLGELYKANGTGTDLVHSHIELYSALQDPKDPIERPAIATLLLTEVRKQLDYLIDRIRERVGTDDEQEGNFDCIVIQRYNCNIHYEAKESVLHELIGIRAVLNPVRQMGHAM